MKNSKRHSKPCVYFQTNACPLSANECDYAHITATPEQLDQLQNPHATLRTKPCRFYLAGQCKDSYWCRFKHPVNIFAASTPVASPEEGLHDKPTEKVSDVIAKGNVDVRDVEGAWKAKPDQHPKYRTRPCRNFLLGRCSYGERCSYLHESPPPSSPMSSLPSLPADYLISSPASSYFPVTPPHRVPNSTPISSNDLDADTIDFDHPMLAAMVLAHSGHRTQTPSNSSDEPASPEFPATPGGNEYSNFQPSYHGDPGLPLSPLSLYSNARHPYAKKRIMDSTPMSMSPLSPPYSMYSSTSPVHMAIVHVPVAVPMYQSMHGDERKSTIGAQRPYVSRPRASSQPNVDHGKFTPRNVNFRTKPCRFYNELGRCHKGDNCNFIHSSGSQNTSPDSNCTFPRDSVSLQEKKAMDKPIQQAPSPPKESTSNFYKISWRVLGGGVKVARNNNVLRRRSEDAPVFPREGPNSRTPFSPSVYNALALTLQSYSLSGASTSRTPIVILQDGEEKLDWGDNYDDSDEGVVAMADLPVPIVQSRVRAKSSPSSPVTAHAELPTLRNVLTTVQWTILIY
ncbi:hypothetical protein EW145_g3497 [Phellinidium pouzarii]|uniref:C3H1-type domain-containing protein n=1 Tax=Phellinidium pouzarii TaxID=167371 RepID=A0A4S4L7E8_9AGAM|nr:hypothetical protein EW145_g3497 [Phellinidium pouzarii]